VPDMSVARQQFVIIASGVFGAAMGVVLATALGFGSPQILNTRSQPAGIAQTIREPVTDPTTGRPGTNVTYLNGDGSTIFTFFDPDPPVSLTSDDMARAALLGGAVGLMAGLAADVFVRRRAEGLPAETPVTG